MEERVIQEAETILRLLIEDRRSNVGAVSRLQLLRWGAEQLHRLFASPEEYFRAQETLMGLFGLRRPSHSPSITSFIVAARQACRAELRAYDPDRLEVGDPAVLRAAEEAGLEALRPLVRGYVQEALHEA